MKRVFALLLVYALLFAGLPRAYAGAPADPLDDWTIRSALPTYVDLNGIACSPEICVTVGTHLLTSTDGITWEKLVIPDALYLTGIVYANELFVAVGSAGGIYTSPDGLTWTKRTPGSTQNLWQVAYGNGAFVTAGGTDILKSVDGITWSTIQSKFGDSILDVVYANNQFITVGVPGATVYTSPDGNAVSNGSWKTESVGNMPVAPGSINYFNGMYVATFPVMGNNAYSSPDLSTWTELTGTDNLAYTDVLNGKLVGVGNHGEILVSADGINWSKKNTPIGVSLRQTVYFNNRYIAVGSGGTILTSTNLENWTLDYPVGVTFELKAIATNGSNFVTIGQSATIVSSADWVTFNKFNTNLSGVQDVVYGGGKFVAVGTGKDIYYSVDGNNWSAAHLDDNMTYTLENVTLENVTYGDEQFIATGTAYIDSDYTNVLFSSPDGVTWTYHNSLGPISINSIAYGNGNYFGVGGFNNYIYKSADGINFTQVDSAGTGFSVTRVFYLNGDFFFPGNTATLAVYTNGTTLNKKPLSGISSIGPMAYDSGTYLVTNGASDVYTTTDLENWTKRTTIQPFEGILTYGIAVADGAFVVVGQHGTIATSRKPVSYTIGAIADKEGAVLNAGYPAGSQETQTITVTRTGSGDLANLSVSVSGSDFTVTQPAETLLNDQQTSITFTVKAKDGLARGNYQATVTVSAAQMTPVTFTVTQAVYAKKGDASGDGLVTPADALLITKYKQSKITLTDEQLQVLDMNGDTVVDENDAKLILQLYVGGGVG